MQTKSFSRITVGACASVMSFLGGRDQAETAGGFGDIFPNMVSLEKMFLSDSYFFLFVQKKKKRTLSLGFFTLLPITFATTIGFHSFRRSLTAWKVTKWRRGGR